MADEHADGPPPLAREVPEAEALDVAEPAEPADPLRVELDQLNQTLEVVRASRDAYRRNTTQLKNKIARLQNANA